MPLGMRRAPRPAVTLLSGGLDSTTTLAVARRDGFDCFALTIDYGQRHRVELEAARAVAKRLGARDHVIVPLDLRLRRLGADRRQRGAQGPQARRHDRYPRDLRSRSQHDLPCSGLTDPLTHRF